MQIILKYKAELIGMVIGVICGYSYFYFVGCVSGTCAITSSPVNSSIYGGIMGVLMANMFRKEKQTTK